METDPQLEAVAEGVWSVNGPFRIFGMPIGHRMTVVRLTGGGLWLHSPVEHSSALASLLEPLGPIEHWIAPSRTHDLYLDQWFECCPEASTWGAPELRKPHPNWTFTGWLSEDLDAPWRDEIDLLPVEGAPRVGEWMFLHRPSRTAITADALFNLGTEAQGLDRWIQKLAGTYGEARFSRIFKAMVRDRSAFEESMRRILEWDFERLVVGHGTTVTDDPKGKLRRAWGL